MGSFFYGLTGQLIGRDVLVRSERRRDGAHDLEIIVRFLSSAPL